MASVLVYDLDKTRLRVVSGVLEGHDITRVHSLAQAERLAETEGFDVALADWTDSGGNQLTRTYAGLPQVRRPLVVLARDRFSPPDPESQLRLIQSAIQLGAHGILFRPPRRSDLRQRVNVVTTRALFEGWLLGLTRDLRFPFRSDVMVPTEFTRGFTEGPLGRFAELFGGWPSLRRSADWELFRRDADGFSDALETLGSWSADYAELGPRFLSRLWPFAKPNFETSSDAARHVLRQIWSKLITDHILIRN